MKRNLVTAFALSACVLIPLASVESTLFARVLAIVSVCLLIWLAEIAPPFVPTLLLWTAIPLFVFPIDSRFSFATVLGWAADPVMALFFGGFTLGVAAGTSGLDKRLADFALRTAGKSFSLFLILNVVITAFLSMWLSNIAAAALVLACLRPVLCRFQDGDVLRRTLLIGVALGADIGGIATPIGTGPNAIAIASLTPKIHISFVDWMIFAFPITIGMLVLGVSMLLLRTKSQSPKWAGIIGETEPVSDSDRTRIAPREWMFFLIMASTAVLWLSEPLHRIPAAIVALGSASVLFLSGMLKKSDLARIDWSTLMLIAGGITLGKFLEQSGLVHEFSKNIPFAEINPTISLFLICFATAMLSALMSNTATAVMLIPLATAIIPAPSTAILIAVSASFGIPFVISTPQNAMAFGEGGVKFGDLFWPGLILMIIGCLTVSLTGRAVLNFAGIP